jgi:2-polyprenyl-3-methyl-5-hydroxy-6-metoxy-1,4-benzoquinol methylase
MVRESDFFNSIKQSVRKNIRSVDPHNSIYNDSYYEGVERYALESEKGISDSIMDVFAPSSIIDVGCGTGNVIKALGVKGIKTLGLDFSESSIVICKSKGLNVRQFDLEAGLPIPKDRSDVALCTEVAEHVPDSCSNYLVNLLTTFSPNIVFTAATPGQGDIEHHDHVNEQQPEYWINKFRDYGFLIQDDLTNRMKFLWEEASVSHFYVKNLMVFSKSKT